MDKCEIKDCCCKCVSHKTAHRHCRGSGNCTCADVVGWVCATDGGRIYIDFHEHSCGCELHMTKEEYDAWKGKEAKR